MFNFMYNLFSLRALALLYFTSATPNKDQRWNKSPLSVWLVSCVLYAQKRCIAKTVVHNSVPEPIPRYHSVGLGYNYMLESIVSVEPF